MIKKIITVFTVLGVICSLAACGSPEEKKKKFFDKGMALYEQGDYTKARLEFKNALQIDPKDAGAWHMLGMIGMKQGKLISAFKGLSKAVSLDPTILEAQLNLGKLYFANKEFDKAKGKLALVLEKEPNNPEALLLQSAVLISERDFGNAKRIL